MNNILSLLLWATPENENLKAILMVTQVLIYLVPVAGVVYAIFLGINYAKSEGDGRAKAQRRIVNAAIGFVALLVAIIMLQLFVKNIVAITEWVQRVVDAVTGVSREL